MDRAIPHSPAFRNLIHASVYFVFALPLMLLAHTGWIPNFSFYAAGVCVLLTFFNLLILPHMVWGQRIARDGESMFSGVLYYPAMLSLCFLIFPMYSVFAAWAVLACGDAPASFFGRLLHKSKLPWNEDKTFAGLAAFIFFAFLASMLALWLVPCPLFLKVNGAPEWPYVWTLALLASCTGGFIESLRTRVDDNITIPLATSSIVVAVAQFLSFSTRGLPAHTHVQPEQFIHALIANAILGGIVLALRFASLSGTLLGMVLGVVIYFYAHWQGYLLFTFFVAAGSLLSKVGLQRKKENLTAEANDGKRGIGNVAANLLVPAMCCGLYPILGGRPSLLMAFAGALAAALADTASSEIGVLSITQPRLLTTFKPVPHGTNGAVSLLGSFGAVAAAILLTGLAALSGFFQIAAGQDAKLNGLHLAGAALIIFAAGIFGTLIDSLLGATVEDEIPGVGKGVVNFVCTLSGAMLAGIATEVYAFAVGF